ncbi:MULTISPECIES: hypothetical protein [unclassified Streptomyces]|uniref:hypothetical protein n=1 Tax=unclassified Streptomyces TaxID=2593676 RepID=UPI0028C4A813|nr:MULTISPECIES: hypothetical protein [unclassified Streptomyces]WNO74395.1 hypothetical protein RPQ07_23490 [Streptomyces sp. AM8-1-1]
MRSSSIALRAAGVAAVLVLAPFAPEARADDAVDVTVSPADAVPGDEVEVLVKGCKTTAGAATSVAFVSAAELAWQDGQRSRLFVETRVKSSVKVGTYTIGVTCDGRKHPDVGVLKVVERRAKASPSAEPTPDAPVRAGGGGTAALAADQEHVEVRDGAGPGTGHAVTGLVLAGAAAVAVAFRGSRRRRSGAE